ncbi:AEC family transporter [Streptomyces sp. ODS28]|uniref:AEC family transporter n=1 Tax=Streptomyces sp. ODS28 TaxID=3136688 RepID=UPI0031E7934E
MGGVVTSFAVIASVIGTGYVLGRYGLLGDNGREVLTRLAFHVATPALMFVTLAKADLSVMVSGPLLVMALSTVGTVLVFSAVAVWRGWPVGYATVGALCASYVNAGNLGIPVAAYVLGDASLVAPVLLLQQLVLSPVFLTVLDLSTASARMTTFQRLTSPFRNPVVLGTLGGVLVAALGQPLPRPVLEPFHMIGAMSVPAVLLAFGISLHGSTLPARGPDRVPVLLSVALKSAGMPVLAWALGAGVFGLSGAALFTAVVTAALPAAQNLYTYASRYGVGTRLARESILLSTLLAIPSLLVIAALLAP